MNVEFVKVDEKAVVPTKAHINDIGYDLTCIGIFKILSSRTILYETGISVKPPEGYYLEILPRSSISKTSAVIANSVGVIDPTYRGTLKVAVKFLDDELPRFETPFCKFQLILRKTETFNLVEVESLNDTERGDGGFGSTG
jgi:dUTP pyrophosphatase